MSEQGFRRIPPKKRGKHSIELEEDVNSRRRKRWARKKTVLQKASELVTIAGGKIFVKYIPTSGVVTSYCNDKDLWEEYCTTGIHPSVDESRVDQANKPVGVPLHQARHPAMPVHADAAMTEPNPRRQTPSQPTPSKTSPFTLGCAQFNLPEVDTRPTPQPSSSTTRQRLEVHFESVAEFEQSTQMGVPPSDSDESDVFPSLDQEINSTLALLTELGPDIPDQSTPVNKPPPSPQASTSTDMTEPEETHNAQSSTDKATISIDVIEEQVLPLPEKPTPGIWLAVKVRLEPVKKGSPTQKVYFAKALEVEEEYMKVHYLKHAGGKTYSLDDGKDGQAWVKYDETMMVPTPYLTGSSRREQFLIPDEIVKEANRKLVGLACLE